MCSPHGQIQLFLLFEIMGHSASWMCHPDYLHLISPPYVAVTVRVVLKFSTDFGFSLTAELSKVARFNSVTVNI